MRMARLCTDWSVSVCNSQTRIAVVIVVVEVVVDVVVMLLSSFLLLCQD